MATYLFTPLLALLRKPFYFPLALEKKGSFSPSAQFWLGFTRHFIESIRLDPAVEELREKCRVTLGQDKVKEFLDEAPFMQGGEYLNEECLFTQWNQLQNHFSNELKSFKGRVKEYFLNLNPEVHLVGRVFFHLVENKQDTELPFAFMATYLADAKEKENSTHRPLQYALKEYENNQEKLLLLLSTIRRASEASNLIKDLLDSGSIFEPLRWSSKEAQKFLEEVSLYSKAGVLCRIPNWWRSASQGAKLNFTIGNRKPMLGTNSLVGL